MISSNGIDEKVQYRCISQRLPESLKRPPRERSDRIHGPWWKNRRHVSEEWISEPQGERTLSNYPLPELSSVTKAAGSAFYQP